MTCDVVKIIVAEQEILINKKDLKNLDLSTVRITKKGYASVSRKFLHRIILNPPENMEIDHINRNRLDNRRCNLRVCTKSQNQMNRPKTKLNRSGFKGVAPHKRTGKYQAQIQAGKKLFYLGLHGTAEKASVTYKKAAKKLHGKFAYKDE